MKYTEKAVSYPLAEDIIRRGMVEKPFIGFNEKGIDMLFRGKSGHMFEAVQEDEDANEFLNGFFERILKNEEVYKCSDALILIEFNENNPLFMKDLAIVDQHMKKIRTNNMKRTIVINNTNPGLCILAICM